MQAEILADDTRMACHECDLLVRAIASPSGGDAHCPRCNAILYRVRRDTLEKSLALTCTALILLLLANLFPVVGLDIKGQHTATTVMGAATQLWRDGEPLVGIVVALTVALIPAIELLALLYLLVPLRAGRRPPAFVAVLRIVQLSHTWAMVEIFILGVLVALVKLTHYADVLPGIAMGCFGALALILTWLATILDSHLLWHTWEHAR